MVLLSIKDVRVGGECACPFGAWFAPFVRFKVADSGLSKPFGRLCSEVSVEEGLRDMASAHLKTRESSESGNVSSNSPGGDEINTSWVGCVLWVE